MSNTKSSTAYIIRDKNDWVIKVEITDGKDVIGRVQSRNKVVWSKPENVPRHIKRVIGKQLAEEIVHRRMTGRG